MFSLRSLRCAVPSPLRLCSSCRRTYSVTSPPEHAEKQVIFSGIQPTGVPHLGNYLGALQQWVKLQAEASPDTTLLFSIADLHAITMKQDPSELARRKKEMMASLLAVGLDPKRCIIFAQSSVKQHSELMWLLSCNASIGYLSRMTQWKASYEDQSKASMPINASPFNPSNKKKDAFKLGLFSYPVLQAADILLYNTTHVPVGDDQAQHLEFTRELAIGYNNIYPQEQPLFTVPQTLLSPAKRVMSLADPRKKMSKSDRNPKSRILITDSKEEIYDKLKAALTDSAPGISYDPESRPGVSNLINLLFHLSDSGAASPEELVDDLADDMVGLGKSALKSRAADMVEAHIKGIRTRYQELMSGDQKELVQHAEYGAERAEAIAEETMKRVRSAIGIEW